jgi:D-beta-D-heptose 7-phosphate kinase/D-beta-D-heptose 1-phosphate adenosyltransferase
MNEIIDRFKNLNILVVGDLILDVFAYGEVNRISPEAPVPVVVVKREFNALGGAANVAANLTALTVNTYIAGIIGNDNHGKLLENLLYEKAIKNCLLIRDNRRTTVKTRVIAGSQQVVRFDYEEKINLDDVNAKNLLGRIEKIFDCLDAIIISDYGKGMITKFLIDNLINLARKHNKIISVDPKVENFYLYNNVTCITPNQKEASEATLISIKDDGSLLKCGHYIMDKLNTDFLLITRGASGMTLFNKDRTITNIPATAHEVYDVTGAGDTVISVFTAVIAAQFDVISAAKLANKAAGIVVGKIGTATVSVDELKDSSEELKWKY